MNYIDLFAQVCSEFSNDIAIVDRDGERRTTYRDLMDLSDRIACALRGEGVGSGQFVMLQMSRRMEYAASVLAVLKLGSAFVPVLPSYPEARIAAGRVYGDGRVF